MTDIVEKLRLDATCSSHHEAAAEIERLRHDLTIARLDRVHAQRLVNDARGERDEAVATLAIYRMEHGCTRGQRTTQWCGEATKLRRAWLRVVQAENQCPASGGGCLSAACGCLAEMELLIGEAGHE
jgi:hypothetical protein